MELNDPPGPNYVIFEIDKLENSTNSELLISLLSITRFNKKAIDNEQLDKNVLWSFFIEIIILIDHFSINQKLPNSRIKPSSLIKIIMIKVQQKITKKCFLFLK